MKCNIILEYSIIRKYDRNLSLKKFRNSNMSRIFHNCESKSYAQFKKKTQKEKDNLLGEQFPDKQRKKIFMKIFLKPLFDTFLIKTTVILKKYILKSCDLYTTILKLNKINELALI